MTRYGAILAYDGSAYQGFQRQPAPTPPVSAPFPRTRPTWRVSQVNMAVHQFTQTQMVGEGNGQDQPGIGHQAVFVQGDLDAVEVAAR